MTSPAERHEAIRAELAAQAWERTRAEALADIERGAFLMRALERCAGGNGDLACTLFEAHKGDAAAALAELEASPSRTLA